MSFSHKSGIDRHQVDIMAFLTFYGWSIDGWTKGMGCESAGFLAIYPERYCAWVVSALIIWIFECWPMMLFALSRLFFFCPFLRQKT
ncbi:hypothetical protein DKK75_05235 [Bifidobacterium asteroides]|uniref:Uncharacterized protein n=1 Tax=Bifidobacterium asteroides TaxID=1684 RepID=A0A318M6Y6_9BIFI|nr:hypothetical protein DKK75_05235 [Bifidobacterium asteroides]